MKRNLLQIGVFCTMIAGTSLGQNVPQAVNPDTPIWGVTNNTGVAIAPFYQWNAVVNDDPGGSYIIQWLDPASGALLDNDMQPGSNPDVAYYSNADVVSVAYENGGGVWVDDYTLINLTPDYNLASQTFMSTGFNPNIDINSAGNGMVTWEDGGQVFVCPYNVVGTPGTSFAVAPGSMPDIALLDDNRNFVLTYTDPSGQLVMETYDYFAIVAAIPSLVMTSGPIVIPPTGARFEWPRVQANRQMNFGNQDDQGGAYDVYAFFHQGIGGLMNVQHVNLGLNLCAPDFPRPVVAYDRKFVHVAWAQDYSCHGYGPAPDGSEQDVLLFEYDQMGNPVTGDFEEVNRFNFNFTFSATSINTEYDAGYGITTMNYYESLVYNNPGDLFWKKRDFGTTVFRNGGPDKFTITVDKGVTENMITVEVSTDDASVTAGDLEMTFALYDQSGRVVDVPAFEQNEMVYRIDASSLEHGIYLLHYTLNGKTEAVRIPHFTN